MKKIKKITAILTAAVMALPVTGCLSRKTGASFEVNLDQSYLSEQVVVDGKSDNVTPICTTDKGVFLYYQKGGHNYQKATKFKLVFHDAETGEFRDAEFESPREITSSLLLPMSEGRVAICYSKAASKNWEYPDAEYCVDIYDSDLRFLETRTITAEAGGSMMMYGHLLFSGKDEFLFSRWMDEEDHHSIFVLDENMQEKNIIPVDRFNDIITGADGEVYVYADTLGSINIMHVDTDNGKLEPVTLEGEIPLTNNRLLSGTCGYTFYSTDDSGIYGVKIDGLQGTVEKKMDFLNSDFLDAIPYYSASVPDGTFFLTAGDYTQNYLYLARERTEEEKENVQVISLAGIQFDEDLKKVVCNYNRSQNEYRIVMQDYWNDPRVNEAATSVEKGAYYYNAANQAAVDLFWEDLMNGIVPDILCTDRLPFQQLAGKGLFADISELMEQDEEFHEEDYVMNYFDSMKYKGELLTMGFTFWVETVAGKSELVGDKQGLTADEYLSLIDNRPEGAYPFSSSYREWYMEYFLNNLQSSFMNTETSECSFDSGAFARLLEIGKTMPYEYGDPYWDMENDTVLLMNFEMSSPINYHELKAGHFRGEDITLVGYPTTDGGNGGIFHAPFTLSINAKSKYQEQAWEIFKGLLREDIQNSLDYGYGTKAFPVLRSALEQDLKAATIGFDRKTYTSTGEVKTGNATEEEMAELMDYIDHITMFWYSDPQIKAIITEEANMFFEGDQSAEDAAKMIQSRAQLYISEQY